jgi:hypothetical protein
VIRFRSVLAVVALVGALCSAGGAGAEPWIAPGQEPLLARMLGRGETLPGGCRLAGAAVEKSVVVARYDCASGPAAVELRHRDAALAPRAVTRRFALVDASRGPPAPDGLVAAVADRVRALEAEWRWGGEGGPAALIERLPGGARVASLARALPLPPLAWVLLLVWLLVAAPRLALAHREDALAFAALTVGALALRLAVPWGALDFAEPDRVAAAWAATRDADALQGAASSLLLAGRRLGLPAAVLLRAAGPAIGALGVGGIYLLARAAALDLPRALLAAAIVLAWPAHVRYSATAVLPVIGPAAWAGALAAALAPSALGRWRAPLVISLATLTAAARPELLLALVALAPLIASERRDRALLAVGLALVAFDRFALVPVNEPVAPWPLAPFARTLFLPSLSPVWWTLAGALGLAAGRAPRPLRAGLALAAARLLAGYWRWAREPNPLFGLWRYLLPLVVPFAVGAAALAARLSARAALLLGAATLASTAAYVHLLGRPIDLQVEQAYLRETAPRIAAAHAPLLLVAWDDERDDPAVRGMQPLATTPAMALATALGPLDPPRPCASAQSPRLATLGALPGMTDGGTNGMTNGNTSSATDRPGGGCADPERAALFLGLHRPRALLDRLGARYRLVPLDEREQLAAPAAMSVDTQCGVDPLAIVGDALADCRLRLGWYRALPK